MLINDMKSARAAIVFTSGLLTVYGLLRVVDVSMPRNPEMPSWFLMLLSKE
jgi:hypothetical protein